MSMLATGPWRRMAQDRRLGMSPQRADMVQARQYRLRVEALERGAEIGEHAADVESSDGLGLDRIERD